MKRREQAWTKNPILRKHVFTHFQKVTGTDRINAEETALDEIDNSVTYPEALDEIDRKFGGQEVAYTEQEISEGTAAVRHYNRPERSQIADEKKLSKKLVYGGSDTEDVDKWLKNPEKSDFEGVDTPESQVFGFGISDHERKLLDVIINNPSKPLSISRIAAFAHIGNTKARYYLKRLEDKKLIKKRKSKKPKTGDIYTVIFPKKQKKKLPKRRIANNFKRLKTTRRKIVATCPPGTQLALKELKQGIKLYCVIAD